MTNKLSKILIILLIGLAFFGCDDKSKDTKDTDPICECPEGTTHEPNETCCDGKDCVCSEKDTDPICECPEGTTHEPNETCCNGTNCVCSEAVAKTQNSPNTPMFADKTATITTTDTFTDKQWNAIVTAIVGKFSAGYTNNAEYKDYYEQAFNRGVTIIVEKNPTGYTNYKYTRADRTLYVKANGGAAALDTNDIVSAILSGTDRLDK
jgi:hypothetical protein